MWWWAVAAALLLWLLWLWRARSELVGAPWRVVELDGEPIGAERPSMTVQFQSDNGSLRVGGSSGCNRYFAAVELGASGALAVGPTGATQKLCQAERMALEGRFLSALARVDAYQRRGSALELLGASQVLMRLAR